MKQHLTIQHPTEQSNDELLTVHEVATRLRVDATMVRRWIHNGVLSAITLPHSGKRQGYRVRQSVLHMVLKSTATTSQTDGSLSSLQAD